MGDSLQAFAKWLAGLLGAGARSAGKEMEGMAQEAGTGAVKGAARAAGEAVTKKMKTTGKKKNKRK